MKRKGKTFVKVKLVLVNIRFRLDISMPVMVTNPSIEFGEWQKSSACPFSLGLIKGPPTHHGRLAVYNGLNRWLGYPYPLQIAQARSIEQIMGLVRNTSMSILLVLLCCFCLDSGSATDTITSFQPVRDSDYIISNGSAFKLGFFSPVNSSNRYLGIWYDKKSILPTQWVANREKPLKDSSGVLTISEDGNLVVLNGQEEILW